MRRENLEPNDYFRYFEEYKINTPRWVGHSYRIEQRRHVRRGQTWVRECYTKRRKMVFKTQRKEQEGMRPKWKQIRKTTALLFVKATSKLSYITHLHTNFVSADWVQLSSLLFCSQVPFSYTNVKNCYYHTILTYIKLVHLHFQKKFIWHVLDQGAFVTCSVI
jgi:hypothetical protein